MYFTKTSLVSSERSLQKLSDRTKLVFVAQRSFKLFATIIVRHVKFFFSIPKLFYPSQLVLVTETDG